MATRTVIVSSVNAAPDHLHVVPYLAGETFTIGSYYMPQGLSTKLVGLGLATEDNGAVNPVHTSTHAVIKAKLIDRDGPEQLPW